MKLDFKYPVGAVVKSPTKESNFLILYSSMYSIIGVAFPIYNTYSDRKNSLIVSYDLQNSDDVNSLNTDSNENYSFDESISYGDAKGGDIIEYDYKKTIFLQMDSRKILGFNLKRPVLFDLGKAEKMVNLYLKANDLQGFKRNFKQEIDSYFLSPIASDKTINWRIISNQIPITYNANNDIALRLSSFKNKDVLDIKIENFATLFDLNKLEQIKDPEMKLNIMSLIKKTLDIAISNGAIGTGQMFVKYVRDVKGAKEFKVDRRTFIQVVGEYSDGHQGIAFSEVPSSGNRPYGMLYFENKILNGMPIENYTTLIIEDDLKNQEQLKTKKEKNINDFDVVSPEIIEPENSNDLEDEDIIILDEPTPNLYDKKNKQERDSDGRIKKNKKKINELDVNEAKQIIHKTESLDDLLDLLE